MVGKEFIRNKLNHVVTWVTTSKTDIFPAPVEPRKIRYIVKVIVNGDQQASRVLNLYKKEADGTYTPFILNINVEAPEYKEIPKGSYDIENPIKTLEGGTNFAGDVSGNSLAVTVIFWDDTV